MIDSRTCLPQEFVGCDAGLASSRLLPSSPKLENSKIPQNTLKALKAELVTKFGPAVQPRRAQEDESLESRRNALADGYSIADVGTELQPSTLVTLQRDPAGDGLLFAARVARRADPLQARSSLASLPAIEGNHSSEGAEAQIVPFAGTSTMPWKAAKSRSTGCLVKGGVMDKVLTRRKQQDFDDLVDILKKAMSNEMRVPLREFRRPFNPHREAVDTTVTDDQNKRRVAAALNRYCLCNVYELAWCNAETWSQISRELGGVSHGAVMRVALEFVQRNMSPIDRAAFWASAS